MSLQRDQPTAADDQAHLRSLDVAVLAEHRDAAHDHVLVRVHLRLRPLRNVRRVLEHEWVEPEDLRDLPQFVLVAEALNVDPDVRLWLHVAAQVARVLDITLAVNALGVFVDVDARGRRVLRDRERSRR
jgi:hypothetical protein